MDTSIIAVPIRAGVASVPVCVHMLPEQTVQAHEDLRGRWLLPVHNGTFDLAMHAWRDPFERVSALGAERGIALATPMMGERFDLSAPQPTTAWWREVE